MCTRYPDCDNFDYHWDVVLPELRETLKQEVREAFSRAYDGDGSTTKNQAEGFLKMKFGKRTILETLEQEGIEKSRAILKDALPFSYL